jgi:hypothetical protein
MIKKVLLYSLVFIGYFLAFFLMFKSCEKPKEQPEICMPRIQTPDWDYYKKVYGD